jgi:hypothetical protein
MAQSGKSWVAVDADGNVVGVALARKDIHDQKAISLRYIGLGKNSRGLAISSTLMEKLKADGAPLTASLSLACYTTIALPWLIVL